MQRDPVTGKNPIAPPVQAIRCDDAYAEWLREPEANGDRIVAARLFWRRVPLQKDAVRSIVRATAAGILPWVDNWQLAPPRPWLSAARTLAGAGLLPVPEGYEPPSHLADFRRLLPTHRFHLGIGIGAEARADDQAIAAVERTLQWACELLEADALLLLPSGSEEATADNHLLDAGEPEVIVPPPRGRPHPLSDSEQKLAKLVHADPTLAPLFSFNALLHLGPLSSPCVDLLWESGKLVVEIDDPSHWNRIKYAADRQRDFELIAAGFLVLRITAEEVLMDAAKALHKIRTCVDLRRQA